MSGVVYRSKSIEVEALRWTGCLAAANDMDAAGMPVRWLWHGTHYELEVHTGDSGWSPVPLGHWVVRRSGDSSQHWTDSPHYFDRKYAPAGADAR